MEHLWLPRPSPFPSPPLYSNLTSTSFPGPCNYALSHRLFLWLLYNKPHLFQTQGLYTCGTYAWILPLIPPLVNSHTSFMYQFNHHFLSVYHLSHHNPLPQKQAAWGFVFIQVTTWSTLSHKIHKLQRQYLSFTHHCIPSSSHGAWLLMQESISVDWINSDLLSARGGVWYTKEVTDLRALGSNTDSANLLGDLGQVDLPKLQFSVKWAYPYLRGVVKIKDTVCQWGTQ